MSRFLICATFVACLCFAGGTAEAQQRPAPQRPAPQRPAPQRPAVQRPGPQPGLRQGLPPRYRQLLQGWRNLVPPQYRRFLPPPRQ